MQNHVKIDDGELIQEINDILNDSSLSSVAVRRAFEHSWLKL